MFTPLIWADGFFANILPSLSFVYSSSSAIAYGTDKNFFCYSCFMTAFYPSGIVLCFCYRNYLIDLDMILYFMRDFYAIIPKIISIIRHESF